MASTTPTSTDTSNLLAQAAQSIISGSTNSSLDVDNLVKALVTAKTAGRNAQITNKQTLDNTQLSAIGKLKAALSALQTAVSGLADGSALAKFSATASGNGLTATTSTGATGGNYALDISTVATAHKLSSNAFAKDTTFGSGTLTVAVGGKSMDVNLDASNHTLAGVAAAINGASNNPGVTATVVSAADGQHLVVTSKATGAANTVSLAAGSGVDARLNSSGFREVSAAQDAQLTIDGNPVKSATNTISDALPGVTINLAPGAANTKQTLTVAADDTASTTALNNFVTAYNAYVTTAHSLSTYTPNAAAGSQAGPLLGDAMLRDITNGLADTLSRGVAAGGKTHSLSAIGMDLQHDGTLKLDNAKLQTALTSHDGSVAALFNTSNGIGKSLNKFATNYVQTSGLIDTRTQALNSDLSTLQNQAKQLQTYSTTLTSQYNAQFTALNKLMTTMNNNKNYLTQLFGGNNNAGALARNK
ncbi:MULTISPECIES: flagellar filament capping protein FliD [Paraburkholderia]|uniref:flagellar filament capping protein FliD n=1 Tax=Paraburkholderia TaxID=1822464 RepID=UPI00225B17D4|nr:MULTISPECIES: flagellar filament capping protein FliD [Paraburkholderia]MCX4162459.1 flagellar filament capping protein FliD [Paraburkholderia megapolitana]MDN7157954.1 flagellar filament capping protein FliD [Paraburkholderia sp. CHISQ3]MDQ6495001.1 flagellar filament capping protein FliD [Paraburkholderia megapolitana]